MKIFIGENISCNLNYQYDYIICELQDKFEITPNPREADIILFLGTCSCTKDHMLYTINYINSIISLKKPGAKVYLTGCMARDYNDNTFLNQVRNWLGKNIDAIIHPHQIHFLLQLISEEEFQKINTSAFGESFIEDDNTGEIFAQNGCTNACTFCKTTYLKYPLISMPFSRLLEKIDELDEQNISTVYLTGTNICLYGFDINRQYMLPEIINYFEKKRNIKNVVLTGFSFKDGIKEGFDEIIRGSTKVKKLCGSLESGSDRLLKMMRKGFTSDEIIDFINRIRQIHPIDLYLNIIAGFPTETKGDILRTLEVLKILNPSTVDVCYYTDSPFIPSHNFEQLSLNEIQNSVRTYARTLRKRNIEVNVNHLS